MRAIHLKQLLRIQEKGANWIQNGVNGWKQWAITVGAFVSEIWAMVSGISNWSLSFSFIAII